MINYIIYFALNRVNGKMYIGLTKRSLSKRKYQHIWTSRNNPKSHFHKAILKYGESNWVWGVFESGQTDDILHIKQREVFYISLHDSFNNGYNMTLGGEDFCSSEYQSWLQNRRVSDGTHPFLGGSVQRISSTERFKNGTNSLCGLNQVRIDRGDHNLVGERNPQRRRKNNGVKHHNQQHPWNNTNSIQTHWSIADQLHNWYLINKDRKRGGGPYQMAKHFGISHSLQVIYYRYFQKNWDPSKDPSWLSKFR